MAASVNVHATAVARGGRAVLIRGAPGSGKSDLALRLLALAVSPLNPAPFALVADDQVLLKRNGEQILAHCPPPIAGLIEVRGVGLRKVPHTAEAVVALVVDLVPREQVERLPAQPSTVRLLDAEMPQVSLCALDASTPAKIALLLG
ncbi:MAG: HPr kinase/phosphorylase [Hyphomicrobiaceae bacterium]